MDCCFDGSCSLVLCRRGVRREVKLEEAGRLGVKACLLAAPGAIQGTDASDFLYDDLGTGWQLREFHWHFQCLVIPGEQDVLTLPDKGGARWSHPAALLFKPLRYSVGQWMDRSCCLRESGLLPEDRKDADENQVSFSCSMPFFSYESEAGVFFGCMMEAGFEDTVLAVSAKRGKAGLTIDFAKRLNRPVRKWECRLAWGWLGGEDWRAVARLYKSYYDSLGLGIRRPQDIGPGVCAHYDLRWQNGQVFHTYGQLPELARKAKGEGFTYMVFGGWNEGGFDNNYPHFRPDPELGGEEKLVDAVKAIHAMGMKALFYVNAYSYDRSREDFEERGAASAIRLEDGNTRDVRWGSKVLTGMCLFSKTWQETVLDNIRYVMTTLGADGLYLDQFNTTPMFCTAKNHSHGKSLAMKRLEFMESVRRVAGEKAVFITEHPLDAINPAIDYQDLETFWNNQELTFPELFRYAFPEVHCMDLITQKPWPCTDPDFEGRYLGRNYDRFFLTGTTLWCYGHTSSAPGFAEHFKLGQKLRLTYARELFQGLYRYRDGIDAIPEGCDASRFQLPEGKSLLLFANTTGQPQTLVLDDGQMVAFGPGRLDATVVAYSEKPHEQGEH